MNRIFEFFEKIFGKMDSNSMPENIFQRYVKESETFVENLAVDEFDEDEEERNNKFKNKNEAKQYYYYLMAYLTRKILSSKYSLSQLMRPSNINEYMISRTYFNSLIEVMEMCHPQEKEYNHYSYKYIINNEDLDEKIRIVENYNDPSYRIIELDGKDFTQYLNDNGLGITISGTLFKKHESKLSLFYQLVKFKLF